MEILQDTENSIKSFSELSEIEMKKLSINKKQLYINKIKKDIYLLTGRLVYNKYINYDGQETNYYIIQTDSGIKIEYKSEDYLDIKENNIVTVVRLDDKNIAIVEDDTSLFYVNPKLNLLNSKLYDYNDIIIIFFSILFIILAFYYIPSRGSLLLTCIGIVVFSLISNGLILSHKNKLNRRCINKFKHDVLLILK